MDGVPRAPYISPALSAGWQSGYAEDCKSSYSGSIPLPASISLTGRERDYTRITQTAPSVPSGTVTGNEPKSLMISCDWAVEAGSGIEPLYEDLQSSA